MRFLMNLCILFIFITISQRAEATICGQDGRQVVEDSRIGRIRNGLSISRLSRINNCTATLIGRSCLITANHCKSLAHFVEFNVPYSTAEGEMIAPDPHYFFKVDPSSIVRGKSLEAGEDWLVFKVFPSSISGEFPGDLFGFYQVELNMESRALLETKIQIQGYGQTQGTQNAILRGDEGGILQVNPEKLIFHHNVDTSTGASGSAVVDIETEKIIGIHTTGGCAGPETTTSTNKAVLISGNSNLQMAILSCEDAFKSKNH